MGEGESCSPIRLSYHHIHVQDAAGEITSNVFHTDTEDWGAVSPGVFLVDSSVSRRFPLFHLKIGRSLAQFTMWKRGTQQPLNLQETLEALHDFKEVITFKVTGGWMRDEAKLSTKKRRSEV